MNHNLGMAQHAYIVTREQAPMYWGIVPMSWGIVAIAHTHEGNKIKDAFAAHGVVAAVIEAKSAKRAHAALTRWCEGWRLAVRPIIRPLPRIDAQGVRQLVADTT